MIKAFYVKFFDTSNFFKVALTAVFLTYVGRSDFECVNFKINDPVATVYFGAIQIIRDTPDITRGRKRVGQSVT